MSLLRNRNMPGDYNAFGTQRVSFKVWNVVLWALALGAFAVAMVLSYQASRETPPMDLRTPLVLLLEALLATAVAFGYAVWESAFTRWADLLPCFRFGFWCSALFRLLPPIINEEVLFYRNMGTVDAPYVVLGACIHGGLAVLLAWPCAIRVLEPKGHRWLDNDESLWELGGATILIFFIISGVVRLLAAFAR
jgi:hypothetical protein